jgi:hypothetical protein
MAQIHGVRPVLRQENDGLGTAKGCRSGNIRYISLVKHLTIQEQLVLYTIVGLLLMGLFVRQYRAAHPPAVTVQQTTH